jgi:hypothetical protein
MNFEDMSYYSSPTSKQQQHLNTIIKKTQGLNIKEIKHFYKKEYEAKVSFNEETGLFCPFYNLYKTDFSKPGALALRGTVFAMDKETSTFQGELVCLPFFKFFNQEEEHAYDPNKESVDNWTSFLYEKVDGSLLKVFFYDEKWRLGSNSTPIIIEPTLISLFNKASKCKDVDEFGTKYLNKDYTYIFELCTPENENIIPQKEYKLYLILVRDKKTLYQIPFKPLDGIFDVPKKYESINDADKNREGIEGYVLVYVPGDRVKIKTNWYKTKQQLKKTKKPNKNNNLKNLSRKKLFELIRLNQIDDHIGSLENEQKLFVQDCQTKMLAHAEKIEKRLQSKLSVSLEKFNNKEVLLELVNSGFFKAIFSDLPPNAIKDIIKVLFGGIPVLRFFGYAQFIGIDLQENKNKEQDDSLN